MFSFLKVKRRLQSFGKKGNRFFYYLKQDKMMQVFRGCYVLIFYSKKSKDYLRVDGVVAKKPKALKSECCEKYKKGKRCKRCPCFDLQVS